MKKEASGKKSKLLWIILGAVALLAVAGVVLALVLGGGEKSTLGGRPELYWNVDREANTNPDTGLSIREPAADGLYYVRFAHDGEQIELPVADKKIVNFIDSQNVMGLSLDKSGCIVDVFVPMDIASVIGEGLYVQNATANSVTVNSSIMMNGRRFDIPVNENLTVYNVSGTGEFVGEVIDATELNAMDTVSIYGTYVPEDSEDEPTITHIFVSKKPSESKVYWRAEQMYDSKTKKTTRVPDENGVYTIDFYCDGETVSLQCRLPNIVNYLDSVNSHLCHFALEFDEEGYILDEFDSFLGSRTLLQCERFDITSIDAEGNYVATSLIKNNGESAEGVISPECPIYDVSNAAKAEGQPNRKVSTLTMGDRVCIWTDTLGNPVLVYITNHMIDSPAYWNVSRQYDSTNKCSTRVPNAKGFYEIELLKAGETKKVMYYTKDKALVDAIDANADRCFGLRVGEGNIIETMYNAVSVFGNGYFTRGYYVSNASASVCSFLSNAGSGYTMNGVLAQNCKVWNVSTYGTFGEETELKVGDTVYAFCNPTGELISVYVLRRTLGADTMYWRLSDRKYDSENKVTTRTPDAEGYYVYDFAYKGKVVTLKTKDKEVASYIDSLSTPATALIVKGDIIISAHADLYAVGGFKYSGWYVTKIEDDYITINNKKGREETWDLAENCQVINVSNSFENFKGEKVKLQLEDYVYVYFDIESDIAYLFVWGRQTSKVAWPVMPNYDSGSASTLREPDAEGWYYVDLFVDGKIQTYKTKNKDIMSGVDSYVTAFGIEPAGDVIKYYSSVTYAKNVQGAGVSNYTVTSVSGNTVNTVCTLGAETSVGATKTIKLTSNVKIYDVSANAANKGAPAKIKAGDKIYTYTTEEGDKDHLYVFIVAHNNREGGYLSHCDHCNKVVYWNPYHNGTNVTSYDAHYYLTSDLDLHSQLRVYNTAREFEIVLDLYGHTLSRDNGRAALVRYGDTLTIIDTVGGGKIETRGKAVMGAALMVADGVINLQGGTVKYAVSEDPAERTYSGGLVYVSVSGGIFNMYDGTLLGGEVFADSVHEAYGGAMRVTSGTFNMYGGKITGGKTHSHTYTTSTGTSATKNGFGGNIYAEKKGVVNLYGGVIENGEADRGGNIYLLTNATLNVSKGVITGGVAYNRGGNIFLQDSYVNANGGEIVGGVAQAAFGGNIMAQGLDGMITVSGDAKVHGGKSLASSGGNIAVVYSNVVVNGGEIYDGTATSGDNIYATESGGKKSTVTISGGTVTGDDGSILVSSKLSDLAISGGTLKGMTRATSAAKVEISGKPVIEKLKLGTNVLVTLGEMAEGANVTVDAVGVFTKPCDKASDYAKYFKPVDSAKKVTYTAGNELTVVYTDIYEAECAHCAQTVTWYPWNGTDPLSNGGHYFLNAPVTLAERRGVQGSKICIDLNGQTLTGAENTEVFRIYGGAEVTIMDNSTAQTGKIQAVGTYNDNGGAIYVGNNTTFNLLGGTISGGTVSGNFKGGNIYGGEGSVINIAGGKLTDGTAYQGGNVFVSSGTINLTGGEIANGTATHRGGNVAATGTTAKPSKINIAGTATVGDGSAQGWTETRGVWAETHSTITIAENAKITSTVVAPNLVKVNVYGGNIQQLEPRSGSTVNVYGGITKLLSGNGGATIHNGQVTKVTATGSVTVASCAQDLNVENGKYVAHAEGLCATCGHTYAAAGADTACTVCNAVHTVYTACVHEYTEGICTICGEAESVIPDPGPGTDPDPNPDVKTAPCPECSPETPVEWLAWDGTEALYDGGHYFLAESATLAGIKTLQGSKVCLDLNGKVLTGAENYQVFKIYGGAELTILDSSTEKTGGIQAVGTYDNNGGAIYVGDNTTLNVLGGTIAGGKVSGEYKGGNIYAGTGAVVNISGGKVTEGEARRGGNVFAECGTINITGGEISDGVATYRGGNVAATGTTTTRSKINISGTAIIGAGTARDWGETKGVWAQQYTDITVAEDAKITSAVCLPSSVKLNVFGGNIDLLEVRSGSTANIYGGITKLLSGTGGATIHNGQVTKVTATGTVTVASCAQDLGVEGGKYVAHAAGLCATCGHTYAAAGADTACTVCNAVHTVYTACVHEFNEGFCTICGEEGSAVVDPSTLSCPHCGQVPEYGWTAWDGTTGLAAGNHYYLADDVTLTAQKALGSGSVCLNLNGYTLTGANNNKDVFRIYGGAELSVMDLSEAGTGTVVGNTVNTDRNGGIFYIGNNSKLNLIDVTVTGGASGTGKYGGNIYAGSGATVTITGGVVSNGTAYRGGNIYVDGGKLIVSGDAKIIDGEAKYSVDKTGRGGNIYVTGTSAEMILKGEAKVSGGNAETDGGNIYCMYTKSVTIAENAQVTNGYAQAAGDNIYAGGTEASGGTTLNISGGTVSGGDIAIIGSGDAASTVNVSGGKVDALLNISAAKAVNVSGKPVVKEMRLADGVLVTVGALEDGASINVSKSATSTDPVITDALTDPTAVVGYFHGINASKKVVANAENKLVIADACPCGCDALLANANFVSLGEYLADLDTNTTQAGIQMAQTYVMNEAGVYHFKLTEDLDLTVSGTPANVIEIGRNHNSSPVITVVIDLAGHKLTTDRRILVGLNSTLTILDSSGTNAGTYASYGVGSAKSGRAIISYGTLNLYSGTLMQPADCENVVRAGGVVYSNSGANGFNMYGGVITGGVATSTATESAMGGNVYIYRGPFNMYGGEIIGGTAVGNNDYAGLGGNVYMRTDTVFNMYGGSISNGTAGQGNNVHLASGSEMNVSGGTLSNTNTTGSDVYLASTSNAGSKLAISGGQIGGMVEVTGAKATLEVSGNPILGNVKLADDALITITGELWGGASIAVDKETAFTGVLEDPLSYLPYFTGVDGDKAPVLTADNKLILAAPS